MVPGFDGGVCEQNAIPKSDPDQEKCGRYCHAQLCLIDIDKDHGLPVCH